MAEPQKRTARPAAAPAAGSPARALIDDLARRLAAEASRPSVAVLLPCYNEAATIAATVAAFRAALPEATVYVYDNNSTDGTAEAARAAGAVVRHEPFQGKGNVVRRMFADVDADIYVMADGDMTYDPTAAPGLVDLLLRDQLDMVVGARVDSEEAAYRRGHRFGNAMFNRITTTLFGSPFKDIFSGYRVFSRRFAKSFPASSSGFEIEAELTVHAIDLKLRTGEVPLPYGKRPENSHSKLKTYRDGARILWTLVNMYRAVQPLRFYGLIAGVLAMGSLGLAAPIIQTYLETGLVPRFPTAILSAAVMQLAFLMLVCGLVVDAVSGGRREMKRMRYLDLPALACEPPAAHRPGG
ncbi:glycosyltransferase involved in cell wall biosynthesis [Phreatobacter oligotrophus]|uniref:Glycosyltransferase involved in cell wall biosynthesis n=1 Tax=Phreatobacter oligotrophus TaxID=1122261 RepID=A0A2T4Z168_9HYPH|nr:glycosyltransferase involved in cell wall biosynthesis [Phreatobacter oligotrophus]